MKRKICIFNSEIIELEELTDDMSCEGYCDDKPPHIMCAACRASSALNYIGDIIDECCKGD